MAMNILPLFNVRTFFVLLISQLATFLAIHYQIKINSDPVLFSLVIAFPLAFSIQAAFRRRDRSLEYFSLFKAGAVGVLNSCRAAEDLPLEKKNEIRTLLIAMVNQLNHQLENRVAGYRPMQLAVDQVMAFIEANREYISNRNVLRMVRYIRDITESTAYLISLVTHRTMVGLRFYAIAFILIFPLIQAPIIYYRFGSMVPTWCIYLILALTSLILVTLSNFQKLIEYPFDPKGMDNIRVREFALDISN